MRHGIHTLLTACVLFISTGALAQEITFDAKVDRNDFAVGENIRLTLSLTNGQGDITTPDLGGLVVVQGPFESSSFNYINGRMSSSVSRSFTLTATRPGDFTIGPAKARVGGGTISTDPITVHVEKGSAAPSDRSLQNVQSSNPDLFVSVTLSRQHVHVGEQIIATYTLYSRYPNLEVSNYDLPELNGFWAEEIDIGQTSWEDQLRAVNGLNYRVAVLKKQLLFPQHPGELTIGAVKLTCTVNRSFFNRGSRVEARSQPVTVDVTALPSDKPADFCGAVGQLAMDISVDRKEVKANEAIELTIRVNGRSNLKLIDAPKLTFPPDVESYDPKVEDHINVTGGGMSGSRAFKYLIIPRHEGDITLGPYSISYYDTEKDRYQVLNSEPIAIHVGPGSGNASARSSRPSKETVEMLDHDIRYLRTGDPGLREKDRFLYGSWAYISGMAAPVVALLLFMGWRRQREARAQDVTGQRRRRADRVARKRLKEAEQALTSNDREQFYAAMTKALQGYLADRFGLGVAEITPEVIATRLADRADDGELARSISDLIATCEMARYAPIEGRPRKELYAEAVRSIRQIENA